MINEDFVDVILGGTHLIDKILELPLFDKYVGVSDISRENALSDAKKHLDDHLIKIRIEAKKLDSYKLISWYGFYLSNRADDPKNVIRIATIVALNIMLYKDVSKKLPKELISEMSAMVVRDGIEDDFGIGKNGVYNTFKACSLLK